MPFDAVLCFVDPSVEFGLRFDRDEDGDDGPEDDPTGGEDAPEEAEEPDAPHESGEVVSLDRFRKG